MSSTFEGGALAAYRASLSGIVALDRETERALARRLIAGDRRAGAQIVEACLPFVVSIALEYRRWGVPLGSGVTEAGCKTVYTQRLKLSGMAWTEAGAQAVLNLRVLQLSGVWEAAYGRVLASHVEPQVRGHWRPTPRLAENAA